MTLEDFWKLPIYECYYEILFHDVIVLDRYENDNDELVKHTINVYRNQTVKSVTCYNSMGMPVLKIELE